MAVIVGMAACGPALAAGAQMVFNPAGPYPVEAGRVIAYATPSDDVLIACRPVLRPGQWDGPRPAVLLIHGGGWDGGTPDIGHGEYTGYSGSWCRVAASWGLQAFSLGYRLQKNSRKLNPWPTQLVDAQAAVRYLRAHAADLGVDPRLIAAWGDSAGGSMAMQLGLLPASIPGDLAGDNAGMEPRVQAVVSAFGPWAWGPDSAAAPAPAGAALALVEAGGTPPGALFIQGSRDAIVPPQQSIAAYCYLSSHGGSAHFLSYPGGHEYTGLAEQDWMAVVGRLQLAAISFLFAQGHAGPPGGTVIPASQQGPQIGFDDPAPPPC